MQRIHAADTVPVLPEAPKDGTPGYFSDGNAATGDMATVIDAAWCNGVQEELMAFLAAAGVEPSAEDLGQVLASVKKLTDDAIKKYAAPVEHADDEPTYGQGNASSYGHVKLSDATNADELDAGGGTAASPKAVAEVMSVASGAAKAASNAQISADGAQDSANEAPTSADNAQESAEAAAQAVTQLEQNINLQLENMTAREYWQSRDEAMDADEFLGVRCMYHLTEQASDSVHMPEGLEYPAFFSSGADQGGTVCVQYVLGGNVLYSRAAGSDGESWQSTEWRRITGEPAMEKPKAAGTAAVGKSSRYAREDHVHSEQTSVSGNAGTATKLATERTISLTGDVTGSTSFDGSSDKSMTTTLATSGVEAGSYGPSADATPAAGATFSVPQITVDAKGRVTAAVNRTVKIPAEPTSVNSAAKAEQDGQGNVIVDTYATKTALEEVRELAQEAKDDSEGAVANGLPSQTGQAGKFLTTNGSQASWGDVPSPVSLSDAVNSTSSTTAASSKAVKTAYDKATEAASAASSAQSAAAAASTAASQARTAATNAQNTATNAQNTATNAQNTATNAQNTANSAASTAQNAVNRISGRNTLISIGIINPINSTGTWIAAPAGFTANVNAWLASAVYCQRVDDDDKIESQSHAENNGWRVKQWTNQRNGDGAAIYMIFGAM